MKKLFLLCLACAPALFAARAPVQVDTATYQLSFPTYAQLRDANQFVMQNGSYTNPSWITSLAWSKITGAPSGGGSYTFNAPLSDNGSGVISIAAATTSTPGSMSAADKVKINATSGTNTGDQNLFQSVAVSGEPTVVSTSPTGTLTLIAGTGVTLTTDNTAKSVTINAPTGGGGTVTSSGSPTAGQVAVFSSGTNIVGSNSPLILRPNVAQPADAVDITQENGTKTYSSGPVTWTRSATPVDGQRYGVIVTNSGGSALTINLWGAVFSQLLQTTRSSVVIPPGYVVPLMFERRGAADWIFNEPGSITDLANATVATGSHVAVNVGGTDGKTTVADILALKTTVSGNAGSATVLQNARTIGGTSFNGSANIDITSVPTASPADNDTSPASTAFVQAEFARRPTVITLTIANVADYAPGYDNTFIPAAFTVSKIVAVHSGAGLSSPSIVATLKHGTNRTSGTTIEAVTVTSSTTGTVVTAGSIDDTTIPGDSFVWIELSSKSGTTGALVVHMIGTYD